MGRSSANDIWFIASALEWAMHSREIHLWVTLAMLAKVVPEEKPPVDDELDSEDDSA